MKNKYLKSKMALFDDNLEDLANALGITIQTLSKKINHGDDFTQTQMNIIRQRYELTDAEYVQMFEKEVLKNESQRSG